jgi:uridine kinase
MRSDAQLVIGIAGATASGKTTFAKALLDRVDQAYVAHLQHDCYYRGQDEMPEELRTSMNFDHPDCLDNELFVRHLLSLREGQAIEQPIYDFSTHRRKSETMAIASKPIVVVEGILILAISEIRNLCDIKIYIDAADDLRLLRRLQRDMAERGRSLSSIAEQYLSSVRPMHKQFGEFSKQYADVVLSGDSHNHVGIDLLATKINHHISQARAG